MQMQNDTNVFLTALFVLGNDLLVISINEECKERALDT